MKVNSGIPKFVIGPYFMISPGNGIMAVTIKIRFHQLAQLTAQRLSRGNLNKALSVLVLQSIPV